MGLQLALYQNKDVISCILRTIIELILPEEYYQFTLAALEWNWRNNCWLWWGRLMVGVISTDIAALCPIHLSHGRNFNVSVGY